MGSFFVLLLIICLMTVIFSGCYCLVRITRDRSNTRKEMIRAARLQNDHLSAMQSIELANAYEGIMPQKTPVLERSDDRVTPDMAWLHEAKDYVPGTHSRPIKR